MNLDYQDALLIHAMNEQNNARSRARNIQDNFGVKTQDVEEYRSQHGGFGVIKSLLIGATVTAIAAGLGAAVVAVAALEAATAVPVVAAVALTVGGLGMTASLVHQKNKVMNGYNSYLDQAAIEGRRMSGGGRQMTQISPEEAEMLQARLAAGRDRSPEERGGYMQQSGAAYR